jgi:hypothetical protein
MEIILRKEAKERGLKRYFTGKPCKHGHIDERLVSSRGCFECNRAAVDKYNAANPEYKVKYRAANTEKEKARHAIYKAENPEKKKASDKKYKAENPEAIFIRGSLRRIFTNWKGGRVKMESVMGYTCEELRAHIEKQFVDGMSWENRSSWHIDHIIPIAHHLKNGETNPAVINCLSNLQPLWAKPNMSKGSKVMTLC